VPGYLKLWPLSQRLLWSAPSIPSCLSISDNGSPLCVVSAVPLVNKRTNVAAPEFITILDKGGCFKASDTTHKLLIKNLFPPAVGFDLKTVKEVGGSRDRRTPDDAYKLLCKGPVNNRDQS
jgi:hypothetical protein